MFNIIGKRKIFLTIAAILVIASVASIGFFGLKQGIDFVGGALWQIRLDKSVGIEELRSFIVSDFELNEFVITEEPTTRSFLMRLPETDEVVHNSYVEKIKLEFGNLEELRFESIGPLIGQELRTKSIWAFVLVLLTISLYVTFVFRKVSYPVSSWKYGVITLVTLFHDAIIPIGMTAILGVEIGVNLVVAILVVIGFSVHDTIVVLDRTRENLKNRKENTSFADLVNKSVNQTLARSINTSLTLVFILMSMYFFGPASLSYFILVILLGTIIGTYSSIFVASSLVVLTQKT